VIEALGQAHPLERGEEERGLCVLGLRLADAQLLRPLDVEADVGGVDAGAGDDQAVVDLHRLQLADAGAGEERERDVLRQLSMGTRGGADDGGRAVAVEAPRQVDRRAVPHLGEGQVEDRFMGLPLAQGATDQQGERLRDQLHGPGLYQGVAKSDRNCRALKLICATCAF